MYTNPIRSAFGVPTFGKAPLVDLVEDWTADIAVLGVPFDQAVTYRPGARFGPRALRDASLRYAFFQSASGYWDLRSERWRVQKRVVDAGDVDVVPLGYQASYENVTNAVKHIVAKGAFPVILGGDHSITAPSLAGLGKPVTLIHFDAHTDYRDQVGGQRIGHAQVIRRSFEVASVRRVISLGIRAIRTDPDDVRAMVKDGHAIVLASEIHAQGVESIASLLPRGEEIYITFDIDSLDPSLAPGTGTIEAGGLSYEQARALLEQVVENNTLVGFDLVEVNPMLDPAGVTALIGAQIAMDILGFAFPGAHETIRDPASQRSRGQRG